MIGEPFGHFRILSLLGSGGMGVVYRAFDETLQRTVAIKVVGPASRASASDRARIVDEARAASGLSHPHICAVYETGDIDGQAYIAMEFVDGRPLSESIPVGGLPIEAVVRYGIQIADALAHAHRRGVIHRDLKTANVVISAEGRAKVLDFGLARRIPAELGTAATRSSDAAPVEPVAGTLAYLAPEAVLGQMTDERSDIWALGVLLYEAAAGELPFKGRNEFDLTAAILRAPTPPLPASVPPMVRAIVQRCLAKEPSQRYQQAVEVRAALEAVQSNVSPTGSAPPDATPLHWTRRWGWRAAVAAAAIALLALGAFWRQRDTRSAWQRLATEGRLTLALASEDPLFDPVISPDGKMLCYVAESGSGRTDLFLRRVAGGEVVRLTDDEAREAMPRFSPDSDRIAFVRKEAPDALPEIRVVATFGGHPETVIPGGVAVAWAPDGRQLALLRRREDGGTDLVVAAADGSNPRVVLQPDTASPFFRDPAWSPDGRELAVVRGSGGISGEIWLVPAAGGAARRAWRDPPEAFSESPVYTADGDGIVHSSNRGGATNLWMYRRRGGDPVRLTTGPGPDTSPTLAADGTIAFVNSRWRNTLDLVSLESGRRRTLATHAPFLWGPSVSPDGTEIAFSRSEVDGSWHVWSIPLEGGTPRRLTDTTGGELYPRYTRDGASLLFHTWSTPRHIGRVPRGGGPPDAIAFGEGSDAFADPSPDGRWIAFTRVDRDAERVYVAPAQGGTPRLLTPSSAALPRWSPDGTRIAFSANRGFYGGISVINHDGTGERRLTASGGWPVWWPDAARIGYLAIGRNGNQEIRVVPAGGGDSRPLAEVSFHGNNHPFDILPDGKTIVTSDAVHMSDEVWLLGK